MIAPSELSAFIAQMYQDADAGLQHRPKRVIVTKRYLATFALLAPAATQTAQIQIAANGDFVLTRISAQATNAGAAQTQSTGVVPQWRVQLTDSGSDEQFFNLPTDLASIANLPISGPDFRDEPYPRVITGRSTLTVQMTSYEAANTYSVDFVLHGVLVKTYN